MLGFLETVATKRDMVVYPAFVHTTGGKAEASDKNNAFQKNVAVGGGKAELLQMGPSFIAQGTGTSSFGIELKGSGGLQADSLGFFAMSQAEGTCEGFTLLPANSAGAGKEYYAVTAENPSSRSEIVIVSFDDATVVSLSLPRSGVVEVLWGGIRYTTHGQVITLGALPKYEMIQIQSSFDLTGAKVTNTVGSVAVFSGNLNTYVGVITGGKNHLVEQVPSKDTGWGQTFLVVPFPGRTGNFRARIVAGSDTTLIKENDVDKQTIDDQNHYTIIGNTARSITADKDVMVALLAESQTTTTNKAPAMMILPPVEKWKPQYVFSTGRITDPSDWKHYLTVVIDKTKIGVVQLDNAALTSPSWIDISPPVGAVTYSYVQIELTKPGLYYVDTTDSTVFGAYVFGSSASSCAYAWPAGQCL